MKTSWILPAMAALAAGCVSSAVQAQTPAQTSVQPQGQAQATAASAAAAATLPLAEGEVRKIDKEAGKVTLRHGPIASLDMPGMTMVFRVQDAKLLGGLKEGDKIRFAAQRINGAIVLTAVEAAQ